MTSFILNIQYFPRAKKYIIVPQILFLSKNDVINYDEVSGAFSAFYDHRSCSRITDACYRSLRLLLLRGLSEITQRV